MADRRSADCDQFRTTSSKQVSGPTQLNQHPCTSALCCQNLRRHSILGLDLIRSPAEATSNRLADKPMTCRLCFEGLFLGMRYDTDPSLKKPSLITPTLAGSRPAVLTQAATEVCFRQLLTIPASTASKTRTQDDHFGGGSASILSKYCENRKIWDRIILVERLDRIHQNDYLLVTCKCTASHRFPDSTNESVPPSPFASSPDLKPRSRKQGTAGYVSSRSPGSPDRRARSTSARGRHITIQHCCVWEHTSPYRLSGSSYQ